MFSTVVILSGLAALPPESPAQAVRQRAVEFRSLTDESLAGRRVLARLHVVQGDWMCGPWAVENTTTEPATHRMAWFAQGHPEIEVNCYVEGRLRVIRHPLFTLADGTRLPSFVEWRLVDCFVVGG